MSKALVVRVVPYGEADAVITLYTEALGKVSAMARGARKSQRRFAAGLEPMHTVKVTLDERPSAELYGLRESVVVTPRTHILGDLDRMNAAGKALRWARSVSPNRTREADVWVELETLLDRLDDPSDRLPPGTHLAASGLRLLRYFGYGLELDACVRCERPCDAARLAFVDPIAGGLLCGACGGGQGPHHVLIDAAMRGRLSAAAAGREAALLADDTAVASKLVDEALAQHAGLDA